MGVHIRYNKLALLAELTFFSFGLPKSVGINLMYEIYLIKKQQTFSWAYKKKQD